MTDYIFILPVNTNITIGQDWELKTEITFRKNLNFKFEGQTDAEVYNLGQDSQMLTQKSNESFAGFISRLDSLGIKVCSNEEWSRDDNRFYDKNDYVLVANEDGTVTKTYPNKTQKTNYNDLVQEDFENLKNQKIKEIKNLTHEKIIGVYSNNTQRNIMNLSKNTPTGLNYTEQDKAEMISFIDDISQKGHTLQKQINNCSTIEEINNVIIEIT